MSTAATTAPFLQTRTNYRLSDSQRWPAAVVWAAVSTALLMAVAAPAGDHVAAMAALAATASCLWTCLALLRVGPLSPAAVYLYVLLVFHLGLAAPWALGIQQSALPRWFTSNTLAPALSMVILALGGFQIGAALGRPGRAPGASSPAAPTSYYNPVLFGCGLAVTAAGLLAFAYGILLIGPARILNASYLETFRLTYWYDARYFQNGLTILPIGANMCAAAAPRRWIPAVLAGAGVWAVLISFMGFRGIALIPCLTVLAVVTKRGFRIPRVAFIGGTLVILLGISAVRISRSSALAERSPLDALAASSPLAAVEEMGSSLRPLIHTIHYLETEDYRYGYTYWQAVRATLPDLFSDGGSEYVAVADLPPSKWVTRLASPWNYNHYGGIGFSAVAEPYMNFGPPGVFVYFVLLGYGLVAADRLDGLRPTRLALWAVCLSPLLWTTRNAFTVLARPVALGCAAVFAARVLSDTIAATRAQRHGARPQAFAPTRARPAAAAQPILPVSRFTVQS